MTVPYPKRLIEVDFPIKRISAHARREKSIRHGHISTLHIWWARRPLAACRAAILAALWPDPASEGCPEQFRKEARAWMLRWARDNAAKASAASFERLVRIQKDEGLLGNQIELRKCLLDFIADFANWDNSTDPAYLETSRALVQEAHNALGASAGSRPLVVDPFAGGGSFPLEALRVGADAFGSDLSPVAVLLNRVILEYIPRHGERLADNLRLWGAQVKKEADSALAEFYPKDRDGATPIAYLWARTIKCEGPGCGADIPLLRATQLSKKNPVAHVAVHGEGSRVDVTLKTGRESSSTATIRSGKATCPACRYTMPAARVRAQMCEQRGGADSSVMFAVLTEHNGRRAFRAPTPRDREAVTAAAQRLARTLEKQRDLVPDAPINPKRPYKNTVGVCIVTRIGITSFKRLYAARQLLSLTAFQDAVTRIRLANGETAEGLADATEVLLQLAIDRLVGQNTSLSRWDASRSTIKSLFSKQALQIVWDFAEANPLGPGSGNWDSAIDWIDKVLRANLGMVATGSAQRASAENCPLPDDSASLLATDPPYFAAIPYADLADVFYVWLRRGLKGREADLFRAALVDREQELIVTNSAPGPGGVTKDAAFFSEGMAQALAKARKIVKPDGAGVLVFADSSTASWESLLSAVLASGWIVTASWPVDTEMQNRTRAQESASLQSSVFMVLRPRESDDGALRTDAVGEWRDVLAELPNRIHEWMPRLAQEGVVGADAIFACLGPALEIFSRYAKVEKASGDAVTLKEYLEHVWAAVAKEALSMIFAGAETSGFEEDARLTAMWLWTASTGGGNGASEGGDDEEDDSEDGGDEDKASKKPKLSGFALEYDAARKIAQGLGAHLEDLASLVEVRGETARLKPVAERTRALFGKDEAQAPTARRKARTQQMKLGFAKELEEAETIGGWGEKGAPKLGDTVLDRVHQSMILFAAGRGEALRRFLVDEGAGGDARFWRLAQALAALYPTGTDERRWVEGVLARKKSLGF